MLNICIFYHILLPCVVIGDGPVNCDSPVRAVQFYYCICIISLTHTLANAPFLYIHRQVTVTLAEKRCDTSTAHINRNVIKRRYCDSDSFAFIYIKFYNT